jgi:5'-methylthioadenosine phosphorylase
MAYVLAIIGGSGFDAVPGLEGVETLTCKTPYGEPSGPIARGIFGETTLVFLPRHGVGHHIAPHQINYRANICAIKMLGATHVVALSAVGSMRDDLHPGDVVVVSDFIDLTRRRISTFFDESVVAHVAMADPVCMHLGAAVSASARAAGARTHDGGTYLCIEGPQFSTRAESNLYRSWGVDVIGMTAMPEAKLAREAELAFATAAFVTDYDCWHSAEADVSVQVVLETLSKNAALAPKIVGELVSRLPDPTLSPAFCALQYAVITKVEQQDPNSAQRLDWLLRAVNTRNERNAP